MKNHLLDRSALICMSLIALDKAHKLERIGRKGSAARRGGPGARSTEASAWRHTSRAFAQFAKRVAP